MAADLVRSYLQYSHHKAIKDARSAHFLSKNNHNPKVINSGGPSKTDFVPENDWTEKFNVCFIKRILSILSLISPHPPNPLTYNISFPISNH